MAADLDGHKDYSHRSRLDKLGVKPGMRVAVDGVAEQAFLDELCVRDVEVAGPRAAQCHLIFLGAEATGDLDRLPRAAARILPDGAVWVIYPKGRKDITQSQVMAAMLAAGLVDVKVVSFSATHTGLKAVIPKARRPAGPLR